MSWLARSSRPEPVRAAPKPPPQSRLGEPGTCPECRGQGFLDHIDLTHRRQIQHCKECGHRWTIALPDHDPEPAFIDLNYPAKARRAER
jgi:hypothetical protein